MRAPSALWPRSNATSSCGAAKKSSSSPRPHSRISVRVPCSLTAEAGRNSRGASAPQRSAPAELSLAFHSPALRVRSLDWQQDSAFPNQPSASPRRCPPRRTCTSGQAISTAPVGQDELPRPRVLNLPLFRETTGKTTMPEMPAEQTPGSKGNTGGVFKKGTPERLATPAELAEFGGVVANPEIEARILELL